MQRRPADYSTFAVNCHSGFWLIESISAQGLGVHRTALSDLTLLPLKAVSLERYSSLVADEEKKITSLRREGYFETRPGLREQYKLQLDSLKGGRDPGCETALIPFFYPTPGGMYSHLNMKGLLRERYFSFRSP